MRVGGVFMKENSSKKYIGLAAIAAVAGTSYLIAKSKQHNRTTIEKLIDNVGDYMKSIVD